MQTSKFGLVAFLGRYMYICYCYWYSTFLIIVYFWGFSNVLVYFIQYFWGYFSFGKNYFRQLNSLKFGCKSPRYFPPNLIFSFFYCKCGGIYSSRIPQSELIIALVEPRTLGSKRENHLFFNEKPIEEITKNGGYLLIKRIFAR